MIRCLSICILFLSNFVFLYSQYSSSSYKDTFDLEKIVISGTRVSQSDPFTFQDINRAEIDEIYVGQDPVVLIQEMSPSIVSYSDGGTDIGNYSQFRMRGMDQSRLNMTLNGVPLNDMVDHGVYFSNFSDFGNSIESIQIQRGASVSNRGVASYGGAINFESMNLFRPEPEAEAQLTVGSFGTLRAAAELSTGKRDNGYGFYGRLSRTETDGYKYNSGSDSYSMFFSAGKIGDRDLIKLTGFSGKTQNGQSYEHVPADVILIDPRTNYNNHNDIDDFEQHMIQLQYARNSDNGITYNGTVYYNGAEGVFPYSFGGDQYMYGLTNKHSGLMTSVTKGVKRRTWTAGVHAYIFDRNNFEYISPLVTEPYTGDFTDKTEFNVFVKFTTQLDNTNLFANAELRSLSMDISGDEDLGVSFRMNNNWTFLNGMVGANYSLNNNSQLYLSLGRTQREPTRSDLLNGVSQAESVIDTELGWKYKGNAFSINANLFVMSFTDEIAKIGALQDRSYIEIRQNVDKSRRSGIELQMTFDSDWKLSAQLNAAYMNTQINSNNNGTQLFQDVSHIFAPDWVIQPSVKYMFSEKINLRLSGRYVSDSYTELSNNEDFVLPSHFIFNTQLSLNVSKNIRADIVLNNVFDALYYTEGSPIDANFDGTVEGLGYRVQPPRNFYVMLSYRL